MDKLSLEKITELSGNFARDIGHCKRYNKPGGLRLLEAGWAQFRTSLTPEGHKIAWRAYRKASEEE